MTLATARARVRYLLDDVAPGVIATDADIDDALTTAMFEAYQFFVQGGANIVQTAGLVSTNTSGVADLTTLAPLRIMGVNIVQGGMRVQIPPLRLAQIQYYYPLAQPLEIIYVPRCTFPTAPGNPFVWGFSTIDLPVLDKLMVAIAASELKIVDAEILQGLEQRKRELRDAVDAVSNVPSFSVLPMSPQGQPTLRYAMIARDSLALTYS